MPGVDPRLFSADYSREYFRRQRNANDQLLNLFNENEVQQGPWATFTPSWTASPGPNPSIGSGHVRGRYRRIGTVGYLRYHIKVASNTTFGGGGEWRLSLPPTWWTAPMTDPGEVDWYQTCTGICVPDATNAFDIVAWAEPGANTIRLINPSFGSGGSAIPAVSVSSGVPKTWTASAVNFLSIGTFVLELDPVL